MSPHVEFCVRPLRCYSIVAREFPQEAIEETEEMAGVTVAQVTLEEGEASPKMASKGDRSDWDVNPN